MDNAAYLLDAVRGFKNYKLLGDEAMAQVPSDADFDRVLDADSNSIAVIVQHIAGNFQSRYRAFLTTDGEKPDRDRDGEFEKHRPASRDDVLRTWNAGWAVALAALEALTPADLDKTITIRGEAFLVLEALNRSVTHTAYHVGQIVYLARHFRVAELALAEHSQGQICRVLRKGRLQESAKLKSVKCKVISTFT